MFAKLGDLIEIRKGKKPHGVTSLQTADTSPLILTPQLRGALIREYCHDFPGRVACEQDNILISWDGSVGVTGFGLEGTVGSTLGKITVKDKTTVHPAFIWLFLRANEGYFRRHAKGASIPHLDPELLLNLKIEIPPLERQIEIASALTRVDRILKTTQEQSELLEEYSDSIFEEMFGQFEPTTKLSEVCTLITDGTHQAPTWSDQGVPFLFVSNITSGEIDYQTSRRISIETWHQLFDNKPVEVGDILYSSVGSYGIPVQVRQPVSIGFQRHIAHLKLNKNVVDPTFMVAQLASPLLKAQADKEVRGAAQPTINLSSIRNFQIKVPPITIQREFSRRVDSIRLVKDSIAQTRVHVVELRHKIESDIFEV